MYLFSFITDAVEYGTDQSILIAYFDSRKYLFTKEIV